LPKHDDWYSDEPADFEDSIAVQEDKKPEPPRVQYAGDGYAAHWKATRRKPRAKVRNWKNWKRFLRLKLQVPGYQRWELKTPRRPLHIDCSPAVEIENWQRRAAIKWECSQRVAIMEDLAARGWVPQDFKDDPHARMATIYNTFYELPEVEPYIDRLALIVATGGGYSKAERLNDARWVDCGSVGDSSGKSIEKRWMWEKPRSCDLRMTVCAELLPYRTDRHRRRMLDWQASWTKDRGNVEVLEAKVFAEGRVPIPAYETRWERMLAYTGPDPRLCPVRVELTVESLPMRRSRGGFFLLNPIVRVLAFHYWSGHFWHVAQRQGWIYTATAALPSPCSVGESVWTMPKAVIEWYTLPVAVEMVGDRDGYPDFVRPAVNPTKHMLEKQAKWAHVG
jgi:hypothetical protein